jgi:hypothetical protein
LDFLVTITYSSFVLFATPIIDPGYKLVSFVFQSDGTDSDTLPSGLFTRTSADDWLGVDVIVGTGVTVSVGVGVAVTEAVLPHELPDISKVSSSVTTSALHRTFFILFSQYLDKPRLTIFYHKGNRY